MTDAARRALPSVDVLLRTESVRALLREFRREAVVGLVRETLSDARSAAVDGRLPATAETIAATVAGRAHADWRPGPVALINASGVILHTGAGRAPLSPEAVEAMARVAAYSDLEFDLRSGTRRSRERHIQPMLRAITGAEASHVTVNAASAVLLALSTLASGREVLVSRGQLVEIGGGFRVPDILRAGGAKLVEVGTTNRTRLRDFADAIGPRTAAVLHVHTSNFAMSGFTESVPLTALAHLARQRNLLSISDNGSGALLDTRRFGLAHEPTVQEAVAAGCDLVIFSGDKLVGGPQAGILVGRCDPIERVARNPLARALRPDKFLLAALSATLAAYLRPTAVPDLPVWSMIAESLQTLRRRAETWAEHAAAAGVATQLESGESTVGGGSLPTETLPTTLVILPAGITARALRAGRPAVVARARGGRVLLDLRTVLPEQEEDLLHAVISVSNSSSLGNAHAHGGAP